MACLAHDCINPECDFSGFSNREMDQCPLCGADVTNDFDESPEWDEDAEGGN